MDDHPLGVGDLLAQGVPERIPHKVANCSDQPVWVNCEKCLQSLSPISATIRSAVFCVSVLHLVHESESGCAV
jgi:hypothetical protein